MPPSKTMLMAKAIETVALAFAFIEIITHLDHQWLLGFAAIVLCLFVSEWIRNMIVDRIESRGHRDKR
jgi:hypothetical protein